MVLNLLGLCPCSPCPLFHHPLLPSVLLFLLLFNMVSDNHLLHCFNWFLGTSYKLFGNPPNRIGGTPFKDVNLLAIWKAAHPTKLPLHWNLGAFYGPIRHPHGRLTADLVTQHLKPHEEGIFLLSLFSSTLYTSATSSTLRIHKVSNVCWGIGK